MGHDTDDWHMRKNACFDYVLVADGYWGNWDRVSGDAVQLYMATLRHLAR